MQFKAEMEDVLRVFPDAVREHEDDDMVYLVGRGRNLMPGVLHLLGGSRPLPGRESVVAIEARAARASEAFYEKYPQFRAA